jgi:hypothetical protein
MSALPGKRTGVRPFVFGVKIYYVCVKSSTELKLDSPDAWYCMKLEQFC